jgi:CRISPR-associated exonuclease Cas4
MEKSLIPLSFVAEYAYCPRSAYWLLVDAPKVRDENVYIQDGRAGHQPSDAGYVVARKDKKCTSGMRVFSDELGISGKADMVEWNKDGSLSVIEYKRGKLRHNRMHDMQLALLALCLEEMFPQKKIQRAQVYFFQDKKRREVILSFELLKKARVLTEEMRVKMQTDLSSKEFPRKKGEHCQGCCFQSFCFDNV